MLRIIVHGFMGKMGKVVCRLIENNPQMEIAAGVDAFYTADNTEKFPCFRNILEVDVPSDVIIDFSTAKAVPDLLKFCVASQTPVVLCTTGLDGEVLAMVNEAGEKIPVFFSANMSMGINLIAGLLKKVSGVLYDSGFDMEIIEKHHKEKIDAPSGTAILLADALKDGLNEEFSFVHDRSSIREKRSKNSIGISSLRGGTIVGEHSVIFAGLDEVVEFTHIAQSKEVFGTGAVNAAKFIAGKEKGIFNMQDLMDTLI